jgi:hypothetical protein
VLPNGIADGTGTPDYIDLILRQMEPTGARATRDAGIRVTILPGQDAFGTAPRWRAGETMR